MNFRTPVYSLVLGAFLCGAVPVLAQETGTLEQGMTAYQNEDYTKAFKALEPLAKAGDIVAQFTLAEIYSNQHAPDSLWRGPDWSGEKAMLWYNKAAAQGYADAQFKLGEMFEGKAYSYNFPNDAFMLYRKAANQGHAAAQYRLGLVYERVLLKSDNVPQSYPEALKWFRKSADQGHMEAIGHLITMYEKGFGVAQSQPEVVAWTRKAAELGNAEAQIKLGMMYGDGRGVEKSFPKAVQLFLKAAEQGHWQAQFNLGVLYEKGLGVPEDQARAIAWYEKSAAQDNPHAKAALTRLGVQP